jgi:hypothetical protein
MKRTLIAAIIVALVVLTNITVRTIHAAPQLKDPIAPIRQSYARINQRAARYWKAKKELAGFSAEGGELIAYFDGPAIMKLFATFYGETGRTVEEYYYTNGKLIFALRRDYHYNRPLTGKVVRITTERFYFDNDTLIRWLDEHGKEVPDSDEFRIRQKDYLDTSKLLSDGARSKNRVIESN